MPLQQIQEDFSTGGRRKEQKEEIQPSTKTWIHPFCGYNTTQTRNVSQKV